MSSRLMYRVCAALLAGAPAGAVAQLPAKPENLQVLPKSMPTDTVVAVMRRFTMALGVRCTFCHVERTPAGGPVAAGAAPGQPTAGAPGGGGGGPFANFDFKSDEKDHKKIARIMMKMVDSVNTHFLASIPNRDDPATNVNCYTCHRGLSKPGTIEAVLLTTTSRSGVDSAIARYKFLRNDMASGKYNFTEQPVTEAAARLSAQGKYDDAIKLLQMNQELNPNSVNIDFALAETYITKGDKDAAITRLRAILTKNPNDRRAQGRLRQLGVEP